MVFARTPLGDPAAEAARFLQRLAFALLFIVIPMLEVVSHGLIYVLYPIGAVILIIAGLIAQGAAAPRKLMAPFFNIIAVATLFLAFWSALSLIWAPFPGDAAARLIRTVLTSGLALLAIVALPERTKISNIYLLPIGVAITAAATIGMSLFGPESFHTGPTADYALAQRCVMSLAILVWPAIGAFALRERFIMGAALAILVAAATLAGFIQTALAAFMVAAIVYVVAMTNPFGLARALAVIFGILLLAAPLFIAVLHPIAVAAHVALSGPAAVFADLVVHDWPHFITGHGLDTVERAVEMGFLPPAAPKSVVFLLWYELGIIGVGGFVFLLAVVFLAVDRVPAHAAPAYLAVIAAGLIISIFGDETTQLWWLTLNAIGALALAILMRAHPRTRRPPAPTFEDEDEALVEVYDPDF